MYQIIEQHFQLDGVPQALPRAAKHPIDKLPPQLAEGGFAGLAYVAQHEFMLGGTVPGNQHHLRLFGQGRRALRTAISQVTQRDAAIDILEQSQSRVPLIPIAGRQENSEHPSTVVVQEVQLEATEPPFAGFAKVGPLIPQQPHPPMADGGAERDGLAINQVKSGSREGVSTGGAQQPPNQGEQLRQPFQPLLIGGQVRKGRGPVPSD